MRAAFIKGLIEASEENPRIMLLTGDLGYRFLEKFADRFPDRFLNIGVAEANMVTVAAGLSTVGFEPFIYSIATFASMRAFEQIRTDISLMNTNVKIVGIGAGLAYTKAGPTHHSMEDIALMRTLPNMTIVAPVDPAEAYAATLALSKHKGPAYLRLERNPETPVHKKPPKFEIGRGYVIAPGKSRKKPEIALLVTGTKVGLAQAVTNLLEKENIVSTIAVSPTIAPLDLKLLHNLALSHKTFITFEEHRVSGGFGTAIGEWLFSQRMRHLPQLLKIGLKDDYSSISGGYKILMAFHQMQPENIARWIIEFRKT